MKKRVRSVPIYVWVRPDELEVPFFHANTVSVSIAGNKGINLSPS